MPGSIERIIKSFPSSEPEKAQIAIEGTDDPHWEIRIENSLTDENGEELRLKKGAEVEVTLEADRDATNSKHVGDDDSVRRSQFLQAGDKNVGKVCAVVCSMVQKSDFFSNYYSRAPLRQERSP
jgi:hypothetical protein